MIRLTNVTYSYPRATVPALNDITLEVPAGQFCAVIGANGAGKSTLCAALAGFVPHFYRGQLTGKLEVAGIDVAASSLAQMAGTVGLVFSNPFNQITGARFSVREEVAFGLENMGVPLDEMATRIDAMLRFAGLAEMADRSPYALSGGQQQRLAIASVLVMRPQVVVLDEPTSQLDPIGSKEVFTVLRDLAATDAATVFLAEQKLEWVAAFADRVLVLHEGRLVADGLPGDVLASPDLSQYGLEPTRYTQAARAAQAAGLPFTAANLPVTLEEAVEYFR
ncbi:putative enzyme [Candidatus Promineifilum breve]|uniref:Enzyme n=1 Tax=Candidatus Promineifilum breve TaxID=1806508 RepID=A0A160T714_9CHLR|nr:ABC transporter ATP-binding protein [Candidatus Promineifilum breve]CUS04845.2 putative enzyme [Candidatus Promineifilum breve]